MGHETDRNSLKEASERFAKLRQFIREHTQSPNRIEQSLNLDETVSFDVTTNMKTTNLTEFVAKAALKKHLYRKLQQPLVNPCIVDQQQAIAEKAFKTIQHSLLETPRIQRQDQRCDFPIKTQLLCEQ